MRKTLFSLVLVGTLWGCGSDATGPGQQPTYESIFGTYAGVMAGQTQGVVLEGMFSLSVGQTGGDLSGSWSTSGTLSDGVSQVAIQGTGNLTGTIAAGHNPSVDITATSPSCPSVKADYSGSYDSNNSKITLSGPFHVTDQDCNIVLTYNMTLVLSR